jgi:HAD superfamily hydrolase (TIGR01490 family)
MTEPADVAFFDLDRTLIDVNSGVLFAKWEYREGRITRTQLARALAWSVGYHLSLIDLPKAYEEAVAHYRGTPDTEMMARTRVWFEAEVAHRLLPLARAALQWHRERGHRLVLLSNTSSWQATLATAAWGLDDWLATRCHVGDDGLLDGTVVRPLCYGQGKVTWARRWLDEQGGSLDRAWFYSDSLSDVPMLQAVAHPVVVNPDPRLARLAVRRGWPVRRWGWR